MSENVKIIKSESNPEHRVLLALKMLHEGVITLDEACDVLGLSEEEVIKNERIYSSLSELARKIK